MADLRTLYRPVGLRELEAILETDGAPFPPRHPDQATFYPVLNFEYAEQIALPATHQGLAWYRPADVGSLVLRYCW